MTYNIRYDSPQDAQAGNGWTQRKKIVAQTISHHRTDICGLQEALHHQILDIINESPEYQFIGVGRDDGKLGGEFSPILYNHKKFSVLDSGHFWLSERPDAPGKGWDATCCNRIVTWAKFRDNNVRKEFFLFNTHFDHQGIIARRESAYLLKKKINEIAREYPVIVSGDFNAALEDEPIRILSSQNDRVVLSNTLFKSESPHYGPSGTYNGWDPLTKETKTIDHIFIRGPWRVIEHSTLAHLWYGRLSSDHFAVTTMLVWP